MITKIMGLVSEQPNWNLKKRIVQNDTYLRPGRYVVSMVTTWGGSAILGRTPIEIVGAPIESLSQLEVVVGQAPTSLTASS